MNVVILEADTIRSDDLELTDFWAAVGECQVYGNTSTDQVVERIRDAEVVFCNKVPLTASAMTEARNLRLIGVMATGTNNVDLEAAKRAGITVCNAVGYSTPSVVQHTVGLMLNLATRMPSYQAAVNRGDWAKSDIFCLLDYPVLELSGKTLGIVGSGTIGRGVARVAEALGMEVRYAQSFVGELDASRYSLKELFASSDFISLHCPLSERTAGLINRESLAWMKPSAYLINTARGGLIDEIALLEALQTGKLGGAGLDTLVQEPPHENSPLIESGLDNLIVTPHSAWASRDSRQRLMDQMLQVLQGYQAGRPINCVN